MWILSTSEPCGFFPLDGSVWSRGFLARSPPSVYMGRRLVPRGSVGRVTVHCELEQREVPCPLKKRKLEDCPTICCGVRQPAATFAEARTEVGVVLSAKEMRTHWEVCREGNLARDQWDADFEARVQCNEKEAADYWHRLSKKQKNRERGWILGKHCNMKHGGRESQLCMTVDDMHEQLRRYRSQELRVEIPPALFKCGQSVLQWWAPWMKNAPRPFGITTRRTVPRGSVRKSRAMTSTV